MDIQQRKVSDELKHRFSTLNSFLSVLQLIYNQENSPNTRFIPAKIYLEAVCFELILKINFILDNNKSHPKNHNLEYIFNKLNDDTKESIKKMFKRDVIEKTEKLEKKIGEDLYKPDFKETLSQNKEIVTDFKYDSKLENGSIVNLDFIIDLSEKIRSRINNIEKGTV